MKSKKKKFIIIGIVLIFVLLIIGLIYIFFMEKSYKFYMGNDIKNIESIELIIDASENTELKRVMVYDKDIINEIMKRIGEIKLKPYYSEIEESTIKKGFSAVVYGENKTQFMYLANITNTECIADVGMVSNGKVDEGIRSWAKMVSMDKDSGEKLYEYISGVIDDIARDIEISDIKEFAKNKEYDWNKFKQYIYIDVKNMGKKTRESFTSSNVAKFKINEKDAYLYVWYYEGIEMDSKDSNAYWLICDALIYDKNGNTISIYDDELDKFLEEMP